MSDVFHMLLIDPENPWCLSPDAPQPSIDFFDPEHLYEKTDWAQPVKNQCGVYMWVRFLFPNCGGGGFCPCLRKLFPKELFPVVEILYIGKAKNLRQRLRQEYIERPNVKLPEFRSDGCFLVIWESNDLEYEALERRLIWELNPTYNKKHNYNHHRN